MLRTNAVKLAAALALSLTGAGFAHADTLQVGANIGNVPWEFQDESGNVVGFEVDLVNEVASRLGHEVEITNIPFNGLFSAVQSGRIDIAISSITITNDRLQSVAFAQPYYDSDQSLTVATGGPQTVEEMKGKIVGVDTGSTGDVWVTENAERYGFGEIRRYEGLQLAMLDLTAGRIEGYISDIPSLLYYVKDKPNLEVVARIKSDENYSMMFAKGSELVTQANDAITELKKDGTLAELHEKWFGAAPEEGTSTATVLPIPAAQ
ncbi:transporter substrate-binding domain-containing protein [Roseovarius dicentrarchi]|uniref:transporter substrate-binding domain-containing protein n=1 Tax=Roseovarius dicentrarchi TaxID=2250573 RepID=UPI000DEA3974|nr:transporter substrate-binding domain-containing protein [Roseovarius dicentrarchi]